MTEPEEPTPPEEKVPWLAPAWGYFPGVFDRSYYIGHRRLVGYWAVRGQNFLKPCR